MGAVLPILSTLQALKRSGDEILKIEGVLSGTINYLFNSFGGEQAFSEIVKEAQSKGYTEPDLRDDLNGKDAARKLLILSREAGSNLEMADVDVQHFLPDNFFEGSVESFYAKLSTYGN